MRTSKSGDLALTGPAPGAGGRPRRRLSAADRMLRVPAGLLWLAVLAIVAVPVFAWMTILYVVVHTGRRLGRLILPAPRRREPSL